MAGEPNDDAKIPTAAAEGAFGSLPRTPRVEGVLPETVERFEASVQALGPQLDYRLISRACQFAGIVTRVSTQSG